MRRFCASDDMAVLAAHVHVAQLVVGDRPDEVDVAVMLAVIHVSGRFAAFLQKMIDTVRHFPPL